MSEPPVNLDELIEGPFNLIAVSIRQSLLNGSRGSRVPCDVDYGLKQGCKIWIAHNWDSPKP